MNEVTGAYEPLMKILQYIYQLGVCGDVPAEVTTNVISVYTYLDKNAECQIVRQ